jgi:uncharacterized repeat protein (TIGR01451 family)
MFAQILRLIVIVWLVVAPLNVTAADLTTADRASIAESRTQPIGTRDPIGIRSSIDPLGPIEHQPPRRPLDAGAPQTITLQIEPASLIANSGATAMITATVYDISGELVPDVKLGAIVTPSSLGTIDNLSTTDISGTATGLWTAGKALGAGTIEIGDGVVSGTLNVVLTSDVLATVTVTPNPAAITAGLTTTFTALGSDAYGNAVVITPTWDTNGGAIDAGGVFTAQTSLASGRLVTATADSISGTATVNITAGPLNSITITPTAISLVAGSSYTFTASGHDQYGNLVSIIPTWETNGGAINSAGVFTAQAAAATGRVVTVTQGAISATATVDISAGALVSITVSPNPANLNAGAAQVFTATGHDGFGNTILITPTWDTNGGTIAASGVFTAQTSLAAGRRVTATVDTISGTAIVNISAGPLSLIVVTPSLASVVAGTTQAFSASGFDQYGNPVTIVPVWTTDGGTIDASGLLTADTGAAAGRTVTATYNSITGTATVNILAGPLHSIVVSPPSANVMAGTTRTFTASGYDQYGNSVPITPTWTTSGGAISSSGLFTAQQQTAAGRAVTATQDAILGAATVNIIAGPLSSIVVSPSYASVVAGTTQVFTASGFDQYGNVVSFTPTWATNGGTIDANGIFTAQYQVAAGRLVTAAQGAIFNAATVDISAGPLYSITVSPDSVNVPAGTTRLFTANGFDQYGNSVPITPTWSSNGGTIDANGLLEAQTMATPGRFVTATQATVSGTATINIVAGALSSIVVSPPSANVVAGTTRSFTANGFDQFGNAIAITPTWSTNGGSISASGVFTANTAAVLGRLVTATQDTVAGTANVNIIAGSLNSIVVSPTNVSIAAGMTQTFSALGFDQYGNAVPFTPTWSTNGGTINPGGLFTAQITATSGRIVTATQNTVSGTANLNIVAGPLSSIVVSPTNVNLAAGTTQIFTAAGFDQYGNAVPITPTWSTDGGMIDADGLFTAQITATVGRLVTATHNSISGTANVSISAGPLNSIVVSPASANVPAGTVRLFTANGFDQYGNAVPITPAWSTDGGSIDAGGLFAAQTTAATDRLITATHNSISGTASVNIVAGPLNSIVVLPATANIVAGTTRLFAANGFDQYGNAVPITPTWTTNGGAIDGAGLYTAQITATVGRWVTATQETVVGLASVNIIAGPLSSIVVSPTNANVEAGTTRTFTANGFDQYSNAVPINPVWATNGGSINSSGVFTAQITATQGCLITATQNPVAGSANVNIVAGPLTSMVITPATAIVIAGDTRTFSAQGFDQYGNAVVVTPTWTTDGGSIDSRGVFTAQITAAANRLITVTQLAVVNTASVNIVAGPLSSIVVSPTNASVEAGTTRVFTAGGFDQYGNAVPITPTWHTNGGSIDSLGLYTAQITAALGRLVTATHDLISGSANVNIVAGPLYAIKLSPAAADVIAGDTRSFSAQGFDQYGNNVPIRPSWTTDGGSIDDTGLFTAQQTVISNRLITATHNTISGTATVNIIAGPLSSIAVSPPSAEVEAGATRSFAASGFDQYGNAVPITPTWATNGGSISASGLFTAQITATVGRLVTATHALVSGNASVNIVAGPLSSIGVSPANATVSAGDSRAFAANGFDRYGNAVPITPTWTTDGGEIDQHGVFTAQTMMAANRLITATHNAISGTAGVNIVAGSLKQISVWPAAVTVTVATTHVFSASGSDQYGNPVIITPTWSTNAGVINNTGVFTAQTSVAVGRRVTATHSLITGFAEVNLQPGAPYTLTLQPPTAVISAGQSIAYTALATDTFGNAIGDVAGSTSFSITPAAGGSFAVNVVTPTIKGTWHITGANGSAVSTVLLTVTASVFNRLSLENAPAGTGSPVDTATLNIYGALTVHAVAYDMYNNLIGARAATWSGTGVVDGNLWPTLGVSTTFTPIMSGTGVISAEASAITDSTGLITVQAPRLRISKTASPDPLTPGSPLQYTIVYTNEGNAAAQNVFITETYPLSASFFSAVPTPSAGNNRWSIGTLGVNEPRSIAVFMTIPNQMPVGSSLTNTVRVSAAKVTTAIYTTSTSVNALPDLSISMSDSPDPARPGDTLSYLIQYRNDGNAPVTGLRVTETYPAEVSFLSASPWPDLYPNVWLNNSLNGGGDSRTILVTVRVNRPLTDTTVLNNRVEVSALEAPPFATTQQTLVVAPWLELSQATTPLTPTANGLLTYTLAYTNSGSSYAANSVLTDTLPLNTSFVQCEPIGCGETGGLVTWNLGQIAEQSAQVVTLTLRIANNLPDGVVITNTAGIYSTDQVAALTQLTTTIASAPDVVLSASDGLIELAAGQLTTYVLSYANLGTAPAAHVVITDQLPDYTTFVGCQACSAIGNGGYAFTLNTLAANASGTVTLSARLANTLPAGLRAITNTAGISTSTAGDSLTNNLVEDVNNISTQPSLGLTANYTNTTPYPGKIITYTLRYTNTSAMDTTGVVMTAARPAWLAGPPPGWTNVAGVDQYPIGNLAAGQSGQVTYVITLPATYTLDMTAVAIPFTIQDDGPGGLPPAERSAATFIGIPDLLIAQVLVPPAVVPGQKFTVTVIISNAGSGRACNPKSTACSGFYLDTFIDPAIPPSSYPFQHYGDPYVGVSPIAPGLTATINIPNLSFTAAQRFILYFKIDNFNCAVNDPCLPSGSQGGLVPEYNETNNVTGPIVLSSYKVYLPLVKR